MRASFALFCGLLAASAAGQEPFPLADICRTEVINLSGDWQFAPDPDGAGAREGWYAEGYDRSGWRRAAVPGVWGQKPKEVSYPVMSGCGWYARTIHIPSSWKEHIALVFLGSQFVTDVWVNGSYVGVHRGGYTPFLCDITAALAGKKSATVVVRVDNRLSPETIPASHIGWQAYGGLTREVYLIRRPLVRLEEVAATPTVPETGAASLSVSAVVRNDSAARWRGTVVCRLLDGAATVAVGRAVADVSPGAAAPVRFGFAVEDARLWSPDDPFLYTLRLEWSAGTAQSVSCPVGLRQFSVREGRFLLNNRPIWLQGFGNHEEYALCGPCVPEEVRRQELALMKKEFSANCVRPGHYPAHPALYNECDRLGIIVHPEIPSWQISPPVAESDRTWELWLKPQLQEMVATLRNHPCVAFWGLSNEQYGTRAYHGRAAAFVRSMDPSRPVTIVNASTSYPESAEFTDLNARNFHYGWYHSRSVYALRDYLPAVVRAAPRQPIWVAELGGLATSGDLSGGYGDQSRYSETYQDGIIRFGVQYCATQEPLITGVSVWTFADFHRDNQICAHGILTERREPKLAAYAVRNLFEGERRLYLCEENALVQPGGQWKASVRYFSPSALDCRGMTCVWRILKGDREVASGSFPIDIAGSRSQEVGTIVWQVPGDASGLHCCWVELRDSSGRWLYTNSSPFDVKETSRPGILKVRVTGAGRPAEGYILLAGVRIPVYRFPGLLIPLPAGIYRLTVGKNGDAAVREVSVEPARLRELTVSFPE